MFRSDHGWAPNIKKLGYTEDVAKGILQHFMASVVPGESGLQYTAGHVMHAVTSYAQEIEDPALSNEVGGVSPARSCARWHP